MSIQKLLATAIAQVDLLASGPGIDHGTRAQALAMLSRHIDTHVHLLASQVQAINGNAAGLNPISQREGD